MSATGVRRKRPVRGNKRDAVAVAGGAVAPALRGGAAGGAPALRGRAAEPIAADEPDPTADLEATDDAAVTSERPVVDAAQAENGVHVGDDDMPEGAADADAGEDGDPAVAAETAIGDNGAAQPSSAADLDHQRLKAVIESLIFVSERTVTAAQIARSIKIRAALVRELVAELMRDYTDRGVELIEVAGGYQFRSAAACSTFVREFVAQRPVRLTRAQLETLALIGYRQPITRPEIDEVRGVDSGSAVRVLLERGLIKMLGRKDEPGRPLLYGTTTHFLEFFGMRSLKDLPTLREFTELSDENRALFKRKTGESVEDAEAELLAVEEAARGDDQAEHISDEDLAELAREADEEDAGEQTAPAREQADAASDGDGGTPQREDVAVAAGDDEDDEDEDLDDEDDEDDEDEDEDQASDSL
jgi:segregation and condensation protein B